MRRPPNLGEAESWTAVPVRSGFAVTRALVPESVAGPIAAEAPPILLSKFAVPEPPRFMVARARLVAQFTRGVAEPVTVVTGPAGSGKTQAVAAWVRAGCVEHTVV